MKCSLFSSSGPRTAQRLRCTDLEARILIPFDRREAISLAKAAAIAGRSQATLKRWCERYGIGRPVVGTWHVSRVALSMLLDGNERALQCYLAGDRSSPIVMPYWQSQP